METVSYRAGKEPARGLLYRPGGKGPFPAVIVVHGDYGLTGWVKDAARQLSGAGYLVLAVDLYRGQAAGNLLDAHILDRGLSDDQVQADFKAAVNYLAARHDVRAGALGILGFDMGGGYALDAAIRDPRLRAVVTCYGRLTTDAALLKALHASVLGIFAEKDQGIGPETIAAFRKAMKGAGKRVAGVHVYPGCEHGFLDPTMAAPPGVPVERFRKDAWSKIEAYLAEELKR